MPLVINDPETIAAIERLAAERGTTEEQVVRELAVAGTPATDGEAGLPPESDEDWLARVRAHTACMREGLRESFAPADIDQLLYDEHGLPK
jgi:hypothetical protein